MSLNSARSSFVGQMDRMTLMECKKLLMQKLRENNMKMSYALAKELMHVTPDVKGNFFTCFIEQCFDKDAMKAILTFDVGKYIKSNIYKLGEMPIKLTVEMKFKYLNKKLEGAQ